MKKYLQKAIIYNIYFVAVMISLLNFIRSMYHFETIFLFCRHVLNYPLFFSNASYFYD